MKSSFLIALVLLSLSVSTFCATVDDLDDEVIENEKPFHLDTKAQPVHHETVIQPPAGGQGEEQYDDEEFVGFEQLEKPQTTPNDPTETTDTTTAPEKVELPKEIKISYYLEAFYVTLILGYAANHYFGKQRNDAIAKKWGDGIYRELRTNFSKLGEGDRGNTVVREDSCTYRVKATGRVNCWGLQATLALRKRDDAMALLYDIVSPTSDTVTIDVLLNDEVTEGFVFALVHKKEEKKFRRNNEDIKTFASATTPFGKNLVALGECEDIATDLISPEISSVLSKYEKNFVSLHYSDQSIATTSYKKSLRVILRANPDDVEGLETLYKMIFKLTDALASFRLSKNARQNVVKHRSKVAEELFKSTQAERQEAAQQRKYEKIQKAKQGLSSEAAAALDEKLRAKEIKKRQGRMKVVR